MKQSESSRVVSLMTDAISSENDIQRFSSVNKSMCLGLIRPPKANLPSSLCERSRGLGAS